MNKLMTIGLVATLAVAMTPAARAQGNGATTTITVDSRHGASTSFTLADGRYVSLWMSIDVQPNVGRGDATRMSVYVYKPGVILGSVTLNEGQFQYEFDRLQFSSARASATITGTGTPLDGISFDVRWTGSGDLQPYMFWDSNTRRIVYPGRPDLGYVWAWATRYGREWRNATTSGVFDGLAVPVGGGSLGEDFTFSRVFQK